MEWEEMYDYLAHCLDIDTEALDLVFALNGCNKETAERILFYYTGWHSFEGWLSEREEEED